MIKLNSLNIAEDNFSLIIGKDYDIKKLSKFYLSSKERVDRLVLEDEFVGKSYDNLGYIEGILHNKKVLYKKIAS